MIKVEVYKCAMLTLIVILLAILTWTIRSRGEQEVYVAGGSIEVTGGKIELEGTSEVEVTNTVSVEMETTPLPVEISDTVDIQGDVRIIR